MSTTQNNNPLHGLTLQKILEALVEKLGWEKMAAAVRIKCFSSSPSIKSSLTFLRKTPWAREQVEQLYLAKIAKQPHAATTTKRATPGSSHTTDENPGFVWPQPNKK